MFTRILALPPQRSTEADPALIGLPSPAERPCSPPAGKSSFPRHLVNDLKVPSKMEFWPSRRQTESPLSRSKAVSNESVGTLGMQGKNEGVTSSCGASSTR